jgi:CheY-like chemotaxis protein
MRGERSVVLVAGVPRSSFEELAPVLDRHKLTVVQVTSAEDAVAFAHSDRVQLVILGVEPTTMSLEEAIGRIRSQTSASRQASLLVLAEPGTEDDARRLIGHGVNRVMLNDDPPELIGHQVAELLNIAPRADLRLSTRLKAAVGGDAVEVLGEVVNLSATGMLIATETSFEPGEHVVMTINLGGQHGLVTAKAEVVRQAHRDRGGIEGIGVRFLSFAADGKEKIAAVLDGAFADPLIN